MAVQTLYLSFGSKVAVVAAALDIAIAGDDEAMTVLERPWFAQIRDEPDADVAMGIFADSATRIVGRVYPLYAAIRDAAADPELAEVHQRTKNRRYQSHLAVMQEVARKSGFNQQLSVERATQISYTVMSEETYGLLVAELGWGVPEWADWVRRHIRMELISGGP